MQTQEGLTQAIAQQSSFRVSNTDTPKDQSLASVGTAVFSASTAASRQQHLHYAAPQINFATVTIEQLRAWEESDDTMSMSVASQLLVEGNTELMQQLCDAELARQQQAAELTKIKAQIAQKQAAKRATEEQARQRAEALAQQQMAVEVAEQSRRAGAAEEQQRKLSQELRIEQARATAVEQQI